MTTVLSPHILIKLKLKQLLILYPPQVIVYIPFNPYSYSDPPALKDSIQYSIIIIRHLMKK